MHTVNRVFSAIYGAGLLLLLTYVPWTATSSDSTGEGGTSTFYFGHYWLWARPNGYCVIELRFLIISVAAWTVLTAVAFIMASLLNKADNLKGRSASRR
jgi:hypothetical protein